MVAASKPLGSVLPDELEHMVFLSVSMEPHELYNYILVARHVQAWLVFRTAVLHCADILHAKGRAHPVQKDLLVSRRPCMMSRETLTFRSKTIVFLSLGVSILHDMITRLLQL
jgi:hypothetical protein